MWRHIAQVHPSLTDLGDQRRARLLMAFALVLGIMLSTGAFASVRSSGLKMTNSFLIIFALTSFVAYGLGRTRYFHWGSLILTIGLSTMGVGMVLGGTDNPNGALFSTIPLALVLGSALLPLRGQLLLLGGNILALIGLSFMPSLPYAPEAILDGGVFFTMGALLVIVTIFRNSLEKARLSEAEAANQELRAIQNTLEERVESRTRALESARLEAEASRQQAEDANKSLEIQMWQISGQAQLDDVLRGDQESSTLSENVVGFLCRYLHLPVGALYLLRERKLHLVGGYAHPNDLPAAFDLGEGLLGQAALDQHLMVVAEPSNGQMKVSSGLGQMKPSHVALLPLVYAGNLLGVVELGALEPFAERSLQFLEGSVESIAVAFHTAKTRAQVNELLQETQRQAEELQAQEEELRAANEELLTRAEFS
jgi:predicted membrane protein